MNDPNDIIDDDFADPFGEPPPECRDCGCDPCDCEGMDRATAAWLAAGGNDYSPFLEQMEEEHSMGIW